MTDIPFGCLLLASLFFVLKEQWFSATICAALAGGVRVEGWVLIPLLPIPNSFVNDAFPGGPFPSSFRASRLACHQPAGSRRLVSAFFAERAVYHARYLEFHPSRQGFILKDVVGDIDYLLLGANGAVFLASAIAAFLIIVGVRGLDGWSGLSLSRPRSSFPLSDSWCSLM